MREIIIRSLYFVIILGSCTQKETKKENRPATPQALQDHKESSFSSKRGYDNGDLVEGLYSELADKTPALKEIETEMDKLWKKQGDSIAPFAKYDQKNLAYYASATRHIEQIKDSVLRASIKAMIDESLSHYTANTGRYKSLINLIASQQSNINDMRTALQIVTTLPLMKKYQEENIPLIQPIQDVSKDADTLYKKIKKQTFPRSQ